MTEKERDILDDLLIKKALYGLDEAEERRLLELDPGNGEIELRSLEMTAAAVALADIEIEPMPVSLRSKIEEGADRHFAEAKTLVGDAPPWPPVSQPKYYEVEEKQGSGWFAWLGWAVAVAACIALAVTFFVIRPSSQPTVVKDQPPVVKTPPTNAEMRDDFVKTATDIVRASWAAGNVKGLTQLVGDIVWSDEKQSGYMTFKGLPPNPPDQYTYQLWIKTKDQEDMIDGGVFDVNAQGEIVVPINAKLKARSPDMFAVTMEKPGGVPRSKKDKIVSIAKVETHREPNT
jgi:hypothetical protein